MTRRSLTTVALATLFGVSASAQPVALTNSPRLEQLVRAGNLYLSLNDAVALTIENNLDVEFQRYNRKIAGAELLRTSGGGLTRGMIYTISEAPAGVGGPVSPLVTSPATRVVPGTSVSTNPLEVGALGQVQTNLSVTSTIPLSPGPPVPTYDPSLFGRLNWQHQSAPQTNPLITGISNLVTQTTTGSAGLRQGFSSGAQLAGSFDNSFQTLNSRRANYSPFTTAGLGLTLTQPLMRGFGFGLNRRYIRIAQNENRIADALFRQQLIATVYGVTRLYYDYVALYEDVRVKEETLAFANKLQQDTRAHVEEGTAANVELARANAQMFSARQDLERSRGLLEEQEAILKTVLSRRGTGDPVVQGVRVVPTESITVPPEQPRPVDDMVTEAFQNRSDLAVAQLQIDNVNISLEGARNNLKPQVDLIGIAQNVGLAGEVNPLVGAGDPTFVGGYGSVLGQLFRRNYPIYGAGIQIDLPLRNRVAQADVARDEVQLRQSQIRMQQLRNQVRLEVEDALIAMRRARAAYEAAVEARKLQEQSLEIEQAKYEAGASTSFFVLQYQSFVAQARSGEVVSRSAYVKARAALDRSLGTILDEHGVTVENAYAGKAP